VRDWKKAVHQRDKVCRYCKHEGSKANPLTVHHIIPVCKGGTNDLNNLLLLCKLCHHELHKAKGFPTKKRKKKTHRRKKHRRY